MDREESIRFAKKYLEDILSFFGLNIDVAASYNDDDMIELRVPSSRLNAFLIGQKGDTLRSMQLLVSATLKNREAFSSRVSIDIADYKQQRAERLVEQAAEWAQKVQRTGTAFHVHPMNPADRRVVHHALSEYADLATHSEGEGRERHIVIEKAQ